MCCAFALTRYPITLADFLIADVTDSMLDGYIAGFPNTYATKVGKVRFPSCVVLVDGYFVLICLKTSDAMYKGSCSPQGVAHFA